MVRLIAPCTLIYIEALLNNLSEILNILVILLDVVEYLTGVHLMILKGVYLTRTLT